VGALQRRRMTGGPMRTANAPPRPKVARHRRQLLGHVGARPVQDRPLRQVGEGPLQLGQAAVEHESDADPLIVGEEAQELRAPLGLDLRPRGRLQEAGRVQRLQVGQVLVGADRPDRHLTGGSGGRRGRRRCHVKRGYYPAHPRRLGRPSAAFRPPVRGVSAARPRLMGRSSAASGGRACL
jgi:hypothetical protein